MSGKAPMSDEEEEFGCSSDYQISDSEHSDESSCSLDLGDVQADCIRKTHDLFGKAKKDKPTLADALANMTFIKCEAKTSGIPEAGDGLFVEEPADPGDPLAILSLPTQQLTGNFLNPPENCVLVTRDKKSTTYQKWLQIHKRMHGYPPAIGGYANAPPRGKKENAVIVKISFGKSPDLEYATILVATCRFKAGKEVLLKYDNSGDNNDYFLEEKRKEVATKHCIYSRRTKKVLKDVSRYHMRRRWEWPERNDLPRYFCPDRPTSAYCMNPYCKPRGATGKSKRPLSGVQHHHH